MIIEYAFHSEKDFRQYQEAMEIATRHTLRIARNDKNPLRACGYYAFAGLTQIFLHFSPEGSTEDFNMMLCQVIRSAPSPRVTGLGFLMILETVLATGVAKGHLPPFVKVS